MRRAVFASLIALAACGPTGAEPTGVDFLGFPDGGTEPTDCDIWAQNCPRGEKCMPWANDDGYGWSATRCTPIDDDAKVRPRAAARPR